MNSTQMDLKAVVLLTLLLQPLVYGVPVEPVRIALGLLLVLFFPGYVLISAMYPRKAQLTGIERVALGLGLSLAVVPLLGLALNFSPWGIRLTPIILTMSVWNLVLVVVAWRQRRLVEPEERFEITLAPFVAWAGKPRRPADLALGLILTLAVVAVVGVLAWKVQQPRPEDAFTQFYVLGEQGKLQDYPVDLRVGVAQGYNVGVANHENETMTFTIRAFLGDVQAGSLDLQALEDGQTWDGEINVTPTALSKSQKLEFRLYRGPADSVYRSVHLFVDVNSP